MIVMLTAATAYASVQSMLARALFVPKIRFEASPVDPQLDYALLSSWVSHPKLSDSPSAQVPPSFEASRSPAVDVFFVTPTTYLNNARWNAPLKDGDANRGVVDSARHQASAFNGVGDIWLPRYRQATYGVFLTTNPAAAQAMDLAETDVLAAFDAFVATRPQRDRPFILAGHSQGALHVMRLLKKRVTGTRLKSRMVAAYAIGWPVAIEHDLPALPDIPACRSAEATGCVISWQTFGVKADIKTLRTYFDRQIGLDGQVCKGSRMLCTNPITWVDSREPAPPSAHLGALRSAKNGKALLAVEPMPLGASCGSDGVLHLSYSPQGGPWRDLV